MPRRLNIPPTKSALLICKRQLRFLEEGYVLLDRKRELLTRLVYERLDQYRRLRSEATETLRSAYYWLGLTYMRTGHQKLHQLALGLLPALEGEIIPRRHLGVEYPAITVRRLPWQPIGLLGTDASLDETRLRLTRMVLVLARLGEAELALGRLLEAQRKTQKRVNALRHNVIPRYRDTIRFITASLEEEERNALFQIKLLQERLSPER
jgi:V/A-type H+-transporting ATPase subunit D